MPYVPRVVDAELDELLGALPAISLEGAKGVGKTATAMRRARSIHRLDQTAEHAVIQADPTLVIRGERPVLIDEWQRHPPVWDVVRRAVDDRPDAGSFLLTGSAAPAQAPSHSGAGRIVTLRMRPLSLAERRLDSPTVSLARLLAGDRPPVAGRTHAALPEYVETLLASGFPGMAELSGRGLRAQLDGYLDRIVDTDFVEQGHPVRKPDALRRWMTAYAAATATTTTFETIRDAATSDRADKPSRAATMPYRDVLERLRILDPLPAWLPSRNPIGRLTSPPKHHLADPALAARLLGVGLDALLRGDSGGTAVPHDGTLLGMLFESLITQSVRVYAQASEGRVGHLRTKGGRHEVDLIIQHDNRRVLAIEVKLGTTVRDDDVIGLQWLSREIGADLIDAVVVHTGPQAYRRPDGIAVVPAALLGP